ncbi:MAG: DUF937 domain-containing protein [Burkholderiaceae bacterium]|jgi:hypothetical protein|nr:DUF937 domain-containing protein [Burkholderiaceae bacterium]
MSASLIDGLLGQLQGAPASQIAQQLGMDPATAHNAIATALPMIMGALGHNAQQPGGAGALLQALQQDHSASQGAQDVGGLLGAMTGGNAGGGGLGGLLGSVLGSLTGGGGQAAPGQSGGGGLGSLLGAVLGGGAPASAQMNAGGILGHIFGDAQSNAQQGLGQASGLGTEKAGQLMSILAPLVMAHVANHAQTNNLDAESLGAALGQERDRVQDQGGVAGNLLSSVLSNL